MEPGERFGWSWGFFWEGEARCRPSRAHTHDVKLFFASRNGLQTPHAPAAEWEIEWHTIELQLPHYCSKRKNFLRQEAEFQTDPCIRKGALWEAPLTHVGQGPTAVTAW